MKRVLLIFLFFLFSNNLFAAKQIGVSEKNVYKIGLIQDSIPVSLCFEDTQGLISIVKQFYVKIGEKKFGPYDSIDSWLFTSEQIIYTAKNDKGIGLYINGDNIANYKGVSNFLISKDRKTLIYAYESDSGIFIKRGQDSLGPFEAVKYFLVSDDKLLSYVVKEKSQFYIYTATEKYGPFDDVPNWKYQNESYAYIVDKNSKKYIYTSEGLLNGPFSNVYLECFSPDGKMLAYVSTDDDKKTNSIPGITSTLWINKKKIEEGWIVAEVLFMKDNEVLYNIINKKGDIFVKHGDKKIGPFHQVSDIACAENSKTFAFSYSYDYAPNNKYYIRVGKENAGPYDNCYNISLSPNGKKIGYMIKDNGSSYLICDQQKMGPYESIEDIKFSNDDKFFTYVTSDGHYRNYVLHLYKFESQKYDYISNVFFSNNIVHFTANKNRVGYSMIVHEGKEVVGSYINEKLVYIIDDKIYME